ncbi:MAG TPA: ribosome maturation factor RimM [Thermoanaerobaculia bacterium]|nr:ribosome maturation factor RimM [Thermoanaerobaculia bacterium]
MAAEDLVVVGRLARPHGLRGEMSVEVLSDFPERFAPGLVLVAAAPSGESRGELVVSTVRPAGERLLIGFQGIETRTAAEALRGLDVAVPAGREMPRPEGFVYHFDLEGCRAVDRTGRELGVVTDLQEVGGRDLLSIRTPAGERDVPFVEPIVVSVDVARKLVVLDPPPGLLDE